MEKMYIEAQKLEEHIAKREWEDRQPEIIAYTGREAKFREDERQRLLDDELKRRETLIKQEMEDERRR